MYFDAPFRAQATMVSLGESAPVPCRFAGLVQSRAAKRALISPETPPAGVASPPPIPARAEDSAST